MPTLFKMSDDKQSDDSPTVVITETTSPSQPRKTKRYAIIAVSAILSAAIILTAILVGMHMFSEAQKEIVKFTISLNDKVKQDVTSDPNTNIVQYHVTNPGQESWIVNDFNKDIQVVKVRTDTETTCYVNALNRTSAMDPSKIAKPKSNDVQSSESLGYVTSNSPISDTSFLAKAAQDLCKGVSIYWVYPECVGNADKNSNTTDITPKVKRDIDYSPYYYYFNIYRYGNNIPCFAGCCRYYCACSIRIVSYLSNGRMYCYWYYTNCPGIGIYANPVQSGYFYGPRGLSC